MRPWFALLSFSLAALAPAQDIVLPNKPDSVKFAVIGDNGTGDREQYEVAKRMAQVHQTFPFTFTIMLGDNMYGRERPGDFEEKFERPYKPLLDAGVKFYASLGNHDDTAQIHYKLFNMNGERFYTFKPKDGVRFFALDSDYMDEKQLKWIDEQLKDSGSDWKIPFFHHPLYSSAGRHGSDVELRAVLEPLFVKHGVSVVFSGHDHVYERTKPQRGIVYFVSGAAGKIRKGNIRRTDLTAKAFDQDQHFMIAEIDGDRLYFQAISRAGRTVESGVVARRGAKLPSVSEDRRQPTAATTATGGASRNR